MITSSYPFLHHFVLLAHLHFLWIKLQMSTTKQIAIYTTFNNQGTIKEHVGIIPISKLVGTELSAPNIMKALIKFFAEISVLIA